MPGRLLLAAVALALPAAAAAEDEPAIEEVAADLAYGYCPLYLAGQFPLTGNPHLQRLGFADAVETAQHPQGGAIETVTARRADGEVAFSGMPGRQCSVTISGPRREEAVARLRRDMTMMGIAFAPDPAQSGDRDGVAIEAFKGRLDAATVLNVRFLQAAAPVPAVAVQLYVTKE